MIVEATCTAFSNLFLHNNIDRWDVMPCSLIGREQVAREFIISYLPELRDWPAIKSKIFLKYL
jgi:hypothetical protein